MAPDLRTTGPDSPYALPKASWPLRSRVRARLCGIGVGAAVFCTAFFLERYLHHAGTNALLMLAASDVVAGLLAAFLVTRILYAIIERRQDVFERIHAVAEINHQIRNALEMIQLSAQTTEDERTIKMIREGVERIERTLHGVLAPTGPLANGPTWPRLRAGKRSEDQ